MFNLLKENNGKNSILRLTFAIWAIGLFLIWSYSSVKEGQLKEIPESVSLIVLGIGAAKVTQRFGESGVKIDSENTKKDSQK